MRVLKCPLRPQRARFERVGLIVAKEQHLIFVAIGNNQNYHSHEIMLCF
jgi:hypothetical protein